MLLKPKLFYWAVLMLAGCSLIPAYQRPAQQSTLPNHWKNLSVLDGSKQSPIPLNWWKGYGSRELDRLMPEALKANLDLAAAKERVAQFRAQARIAGAPLLPAISATGSYQFDEGTGSRDRATAWQGSWNMSYEIDLWGGIRAGRDSAKALLREAKYSLEALRLIVMGDVGRTYFTIVGLKARRAIAENNLRNISDVLAIINARFDAGAVSALEVAQQQTEQANAAAILAQLDQQIAQTENALAVLLGRAPQQFKVTANSFQQLQLPTVSPLQPAVLLNRRPDIASAEASLIAAHADIGKARAAFYPRLQLGADNIFTAATISQPAGIAIMAASSLTAPIFQGGRLEGELGRTQARRQELVEIYRKTILTAYQEVEDALAIGKQAVLRKEKYRIAVASARQAYDLALDRYMAGAIDYQTLLIVQRSLFTTQDNEVQAQADVLAASVLLFKALGGGWDQS